jgi:hypothetical protein
MSLVQARALPGLFLLAAIVRINDPEFKQVSTALLTAFVLNCKPLAWPILPFRHLDEGAIMRSRKSNRTDGRHRGTIR